MKEIKEHQIKARITNQDKERIEIYCAAHGLNISQFLRMAINEILSKEENINE